MTLAANWINVLSLVCIAFLLLSFAVLPVGKTHRHYLSVCLAIGVTLMSVSISTEYTLGRCLFVISLGSSSRSERNHNNASMTLHLMAWPQVPHAQFLGHS